MDLQNIWIGNNLSPTDSVLLGFSGGSDSMFLLQAALAFFKPQHIHILYCDHGLRPKEVASERELVKQTAEKFGVHFCIRKLPVRLYAQQNKHSLETAGRQLRYKMFAHIARLRRISAVCTAHHSDDVVETVFHHLIRGTVKPAGIAKRYLLSDSVMIIRPLLSFSKAYILSELSRLNLSFLHDSSNDDLVFTRNKIRHQLLPIAKDINPKYADHVLHFSSMYKALYDEVFECIKPELDRVLYSEKGVTISISSLVSWNSLKKSMFVREVFSRLDPKMVSSLSSVHIDSVVQLIDTGKTGQSCSLPLRYIAQRGYDTLLILKPSILTSYSYTVPSFSQSLVISECALRVSFELLKNDQSHYKSGSLECFLNADYLDIHTFYIRNRCVGDRFQPFGKDHSIRLSRYLIDKKVMRRDRDILPLFFNRDDLVWVVGLAVSDKLKVTSSTCNVLHISIEKLNESETI
jgi:tRNA(Ile)-lysidine synthase